jgi:hypothetical protein
MHGKDEKCVQYFGLKSERKRPFGRSRHRWEDDIKMDLGVIGWEVVGWINLTQNKINGGFLSTR